ncbi:A24 family peptidase [Granulicella sp. S156]|jgi:leader peptidase (prepilin peptidase)/N-methyltransferase|uniref:prepilin peptidase n=1 Tax=Granulicella sp. S156 TaxID=1747224 RepID=UPI00131D30F6|nr:A24 family peptidase [Granulicella sp. S156]
MLSPLAFELPVFVLGLLFGSFLNVCISRLPDHRSIIKPRSHCPKCKQTIRWYDNIPLLSWVLLRARCRHCKTPISWQYPLVELAMGLWFLEILSLVFTLEMDNVHGLPGPTTNDFIGIAAFAILGFLLIGLIVMDWQTHTLPDAFTLTGTAIGFFLVCVQAIFLAPGEDDIKLTPRHDLRISSPGSFAAKGNVFLTGPEHLVFGRLAAIVGAALLLLAIRAIYKAVRHREGLGLGDVKLLAMIAAFLGFWPAILALFLGVILTSVYAVILLARRKADATTHLPLGTFLSIGGLIAALFGGPVIAWYSSLL